MPRGPWPCALGAPIGRTGVISRVQYRQALTRRNAGLKEDSPQKNRKIPAVARHKAHGEKAAGYTSAICERFLTIAIFEKKMAGATGLEPATFGVTGRHSNQLSYAPAAVPFRATREGGRCTGVPLPCQAVGLLYGVPPPGPPGPPGGSPPPRRPRRCSPPSPSGGGVVSGSVSGSFGLAAPPRCNSLGSSLPS